jgi:probable phosphoglycerate mutase
MAGVKGCTGLSERGSLQAAAVAGRLHETMPKDALYLSSPVARARETADIIAARLGVSVSEEPSLSSFDPGEADGMPHADYFEKYGEFSLSEYPDRPISPGGDSWNSLMRRVRDGLNTLKAQHKGKTVIAITHGEVVMMSMLILLRIKSDGERAYLDPENTSITEWDFSEPRTRLVRYNDHSHLDDMAGEGA